MRKKTIMLLSALIVALSPVSVVAAEVNQENAEDLAETQKVKATDEDQSEAEEVEEEGTESNEDEAEDSEDTEAVAEEAVEENVEGNEDSTEEAAAEEEEVVEDEEELAEEEEAEEEDFNFKDILGSANGDITYDISKGYYILELQAGFNNFNSNQNIENKWVAFALPNGVSVADELPAGVVQVFVAGKSGLAVKVPNVKGIAGELVYRDIPLTGVMDDNDPVENLYMLEVDTDTNQYVEIGEVSSQRDIDFSVMEENPAINLDVSINGSTSLNEDEAIYDVTTSMKVDNIGDYDLDGLYAGIPIDDSIAFVHPDGYDKAETLRDSSTGETYVLFPLGENDEQSFTFAAYGTPGKKFETSEIPLFHKSDNGFRSIGVASGNGVIDATNMTEDWFFSASSEILTDSPNVGQGEKEFRFNYDFRNLTTEDFEKLSIEYIVPDDITIIEPRYIGGQNIDWEGNVATISYGKMYAGSGYKGYFTAIGETDLTTAQLKDLAVKVTFFGEDGEVVDEVSTSFIEGAYEDDGLGDGDDGTDEGDGDGTGEGDDGTGEGDGGTGEGDDDTGEGEGDDDTGEGEGDDGIGEGDGGTDEGNNGETDGQEKEEDPEVEIIPGDDNNDDGAEVGTSDSSDSGDNELPNTATDTFNVMLMGTALLLIGGAAFAIRRKVTTK